MYISNTNRFERCDKSLLLIKNPLLLSPWERFQNRWAWLQLLHSIVALTAPYQTHRSKMSYHPMKHAPASFGTLPTQPQ